MAAVVVVVDVDSGGRGGCSPAARCAAGDRSRASQRSAIAVLSRAGHDDDQGISAPGTAACRMVARPVDDDDGGGGGTHRRR